MKKLIIALLFLSIIPPVFAQTQNKSDNLREQPDLYYVNVPVERIYFAGMGYVVQYRKSTTQIGTLGIPYTWFTDPASKAELVKLPKGPNWPNMTIFYRDGNFSHIRLYVHREKSHQTWGLTPQGSDVSRHFQDQSSFKFDY